METFVTVAKISNLVDLSQRRTVLAQVDLQALQAPTKQINRIRAKNCAPLALFLI
jgi:hypothetical protein